MINYLSGPSPGRSFQDDPKVVYFSLITDPGTLVELAGATFLLGELGPEALKP
jgi:hypothetical protein